MIRPLIFALALLPATAHAQGPVRLNVLTFNIWYGGDQVRFASVIAAIKLADADIVGRQEPDGKTLEIAALESRVNQTIYRLHALTPAEIRLIETDK